MPEFAASSNGRVVSAREVAGATKDVYACTICKERLIHVRASNNVTSYFRHMCANGGCILSCKENFPTTEFGAVSEIVQPSTRRNNAMTAWHSGWQTLGQRRWPTRYEARGIGAQLRRPRDLGDVDTNRIIEFQHSPITKAEFDDRNTGVSHALWIFDATEEGLFSYEKYADSVCFCIDTFRHSYASSNNCTVLFHCNDGKLYQAICDNAVHIRVDTNELSGDKYVRLLRRIGRGHELLDEFFGEGLWPLDAWSMMPKIKVVIPTNTPLHVLSEAGRKEIDSIHREFVCRWPVAPLTIVHAPPGAGKTTALLSAIRSWGDQRVLVVAYNKSVQETMNHQLQEWGLHTRALAKTLDCLCFNACTSKTDFDACFTDKTLLEKYWPKTKWFQKIPFGGRNSSSLINFCLRHPNSGVRETCKFHQKLTMFKGSGEWSVKSDNFPIKQICEGHRTFASCRLACDRLNLLVHEFSKYDIVLVDEMQDVMSAQELRLLRQSRCPLVLLGDPMQAINNFRDYPPCEQCQMQTEPLPTDLPQAINWYGTWRLDRFTVRFIEERFGRIMYSFRSAIEDSKVFWQMELCHPDNTLVICRSNESVIKTLDTFPGIHIVKGIQLAGRLRSARKDRSQTLPMARYAQSLDESDFHRVCHMLCERNTELHNVKNQTAASTVHQVKGFEYDNCAVHGDLLDPQSEDERNTSFVAFTRHRNTLVVLAKIASVSPIPRERDIEEVTMPESKRRRNDTYYY